MLKRPFFRFLVVGALNTFFGYLVYAGLLFAGLTYAYANLVALIAGVLFSFRTQGAFVFHNRDKSRFGRFVVCWTLIYVMNVFFIRLMMSKGFDAYISGALAIPPIAVLSYFAQKLLVFRTQNTQT